jgi:peptide/nickel transport system substrate-binding protein
VTLDHPANNPIADIAQALQQNLSSVGIKVNLIRAESRQVTTKVRLRHHQLAIGQWGSDYFDPNSNAQWFRQQRRHTAAQRRLDRGLDEQGHNQSRHRRGQ